jgi:hypothetical protein
VFRREVYLEIQQERGLAEDGEADPRPEVDRALHTLGDA